MSDNFRRVREVVVNERPHYNARGAGARQRNQAARLETRQAQRQAAEAEGRLEEALTREDRLHAELQEYKRKYMIERDYVDHALKKTKKLQSEIQELTDERDELKDKVAELREELEGMKQRKKQRKEDRAEKRAANGGYD